MCSLQNPQQRTINSCQMNGQTREGTNEWTHWLLSTGDPVWTPSWLNMGCCDTRLCRAGAERRNHVLLS